MTIKSDKVINNYINGQLVSPKNGLYIENINPSNGEAYSSIPDSDILDVNAAVAAAKKAFPIWSNIGVDKRFRLLMRVADIIEQNLEKFAKAESIDSGKPLKVSRAIDIPRAQSNFSFFASAIVHFSSESHRMENEAINYTVRKPIGVVGCISPWNLPLYLLTWKIAPALAAGNCVVAKPSEVTPMTAYLLSKAFIEAGIPPGVLNIVHGRGHRTGQALVEHPDVKAISFTGGTQTGKIIAQTAAPLFKKLSLELGGKNPNIIFDDCDFDEAMKTTLKSSFSNNGQICLCGSRIYVQRGIYEKFKEEFVRKVSYYKVGNPLKESTDLGAISSYAHWDKILKHIEVAKDEGGKILVGGEATIIKGLEKGYYIKPTVIEGLDHSCSTIQEEIFGPVVTITPFDTEEEVIGLANGTKYGLSATIWTKDINKAMRLSEQIESGIVWINCWMVRDLRTPFGGAKASGVGREGGLEALRFFTEPKNVCIKYH